MNKYAIAFDIGGLFIKSAVLTEQGQVSPGTYAIYPSRSKDSKEELLQYLVQLIKQQTNRVMDKYFAIYGVGYAFPGPFDYENGVSFIQGVEKFDDLYGVNLRQELTERLNQDRSFTAKQTEDFRIVFDNDANLFALGVSLNGRASAYRRSLCVTLGTGAGSAFIEDGRLITNRDDVPENGWIYNTQFNESIVDDYISNRGILRLAVDAGIQLSELNVKAIADLAQEQDPIACQVFHRFGRNMGQALNPFVRSFQPGAVILGGQIARSRVLFEAGLQETLENKAIDIVTVDETSLSTFSGVAHLLNQHRISSS